MNKNMFASLMESNRLLRDCNLLEVSPEKAAKVADEVATRFGSKTGGYFSGKNKQQFNRLKARKERLAAKPDTRTAPPRKSEITGEDLPGAEVPKAKLNSRAKGEIENKGYTGFQRDVAKGSEFVGKAHAKADKFVKGIGGGKLVKGAGLMAAGAIPAYALGAHHAGEAAKQMAWKYGVPAVAGGAALGYVAGNSRESFSIKTRSGLNVLREALSAKGFAKLNALGLGQFGDKLADLGKKAEVTKVAPKHEVGAALAKKISGTSERTAEHVNKKVDQGKKFVKRKIKDAKDYATSGTKTLGKAALAGGGLYGAFKLAQHLRKAKPMLKADLSAVSHGQKAMQFAKAHKGKIAAGIGGGLALKYATAKLKTHRESAAKEKHSTAKKIAAVGATGIAAKLAHHHLTKPKYDSFAHTKAGAKIGAVAGGLSGAGLVGRKMHAGGGFSSYGSKHTLINDTLNHIGATASGGAAVGAGAGLASDALRHLTKRAIEKAKPTWRDVGSAAAQKVRKFFKRK